MGMVVSNYVRYYKTAQEAIASVNPSMRSFLCPKPGLKDAALALNNKLGKLEADFAADNLTGMKELVSVLKNMHTNWVGEELAILNALEKCMNYLSKGELGEAMFKTRLKSDKNFAELLRGVGLQV